MVRPALLVHALAIAQTVGAAGTTAPSEPGIVLAADRAEIMLVARTVGRPTEGEVSVTIVAPSKAVSGHLKATRLPPGVQLTSGGLAELIEIPAGGSMQRTLRFRGRDPLRLDGSPHPLTLAFTPARGNGTGGPATLDLAVAAVPWRLEVTDAGRPCAGAPWWFGGARLYPDGRVQLWAQIRSGKDRKVRVRVSATVGSRAVARAEFEVSGRDEAHISLVGRAILPDGGADGASVATATTRDLKVRQFDVMPFDYLGVVRARTDLALSCAVASD